MPTHLVERLIPLAPDDPAESDRLRVEFLHEGRHVFTFVVQYELSIAGKYYPVVRYDSAHGTPHCDILDAYGNKTKKIDLGHLTYAEALTFGWNDIKANWRSYRATFLAGMRGQ